MPNPFEKYLTVEDREHIQVANYIKDMLPDVVAFHVPNEGKKSAFERYKHSLMGALRGCPDFVLLWPKYTSIHSTEILYHGLLIELKAPEHNRVVKRGKKAGKIVKSKGKLSPEQEAIINRLNQIKYLAVCCFGAYEAIQVIQSYFSDYLSVKRSLKKKNA